MNDHDRTLINGEVYGHESTDTVQEVSLPWALICMLGFVVISVLALYFVEPVGDVVRRYEAKTIAMYTGEPVLVRGTDDKYIMPDGRAVSVAEKASYRFNFPGRFKDGYMVEFTGVYHIEIDKDKAKDILSMYRDQYVLRNQIEASIRHVLRMAALEVSSEDMYESTDKFGVALRKAIAEDNMKLPGGVILDVDLGQAKMY